MPSGRDYGSILLAPSAAIEGERSVARILVKQGWLRTRVQDKREKSEYGFNVGSFVWGDLG